MTEFPRDRGMIPAEPPSSVDFSRVREDQVEAAQLIHRTLTSLKRPVPRWVELVRKAVPVEMDSSVTPGLVFRGAERLAQLRRAWLLPEQFDATTDPLTGLGNRRHFYDRAEAAMAGSPDMKYSALILNIDRFKLVNDTHGHHVGDEVLRGVARRIRAVIGQNDVLARVGGDEFVVLTNTLDPEALADRLNAAVNAAPFDVGPQLVSVSISIGLASESEDDEAPSEPRLSRLVERADFALYQSRRHGGDRVGARI